MGTQFHQGLPGEVFSDSQNFKRKKSYCKSKKIILKILKINLKK